MLALSTGRPLALIPHETATLACKQWLEYPQAAELHFRELLSILDEEGSDYSS